MLFVCVVVGFCGGGFAGPRRDCRGLGEGEGKAGEVEDDGEEIVVHGEVAPVVI